MGDMMSLIETAQEKIDQEEMAEQERRAREGKFTLDDFRKMMNQTKKLGPLGKVIGMIPGMSQLTEMMGDADHDAEMRRLGGIIDSMTPDERRNPTRIIDPARRRRIAAGAGVDPSEISQLVKQFDGMAQMVTKMAGMGMRDRIKAINDMKNGGLLNPGAQLAKSKQGTGKRLTAEERNKLKKQREKELRKRKRDQKKG